MAKLQKEGAKRRSSPVYALDGGRFPIEDIAHGAHALNRLKSAKITKEEKKAVRKAVYGRFPQLKPGGGSS